MKHSISVTVGAHGNLDFRSNFGFRESFREQHLAILLLKFQAIKCDAELGSVAIQLLLLKQNWLYS